MKTTLGIFAMVVGAAGLLTVGASASRAAMINVTTTASGTGGPGCTLRDAITAANSDAGVGECPAGAGDDIIVLTAATYDLVAVDNTINDEPNGLPSIVTTIRIDGHGATIQRSQPPRTPFRILHVTATGNLTLENLTVRGGQGSRGYSDPLGGRGVRGASGGAILNAGGALNLIRVTITENATGDGGGGDSPGDGGVGGGIAQFRGSLTIVDSAITNNFTGRGGNGLGAGDGGDGGGMYLIGAEADVRGSTISGNVTGSGGSRYSTSRGMGHGGAGAAMFALGGQVTIVNSTLSDNVTGAGGGRGFGGDPDGPGGNGGAIAWSEGEEEAGTMTLRNCTVSHNRTGTGGADGALPGVSGGIYSVRSRAGSLILADTILANNTTPAGSSDCVGPVHSEGYNLIGTPGQCDVSAVLTGNIIGQAAQLGALQDNGGPTQTRALSPQSPAIDAGNPSGCMDAEGQLLVADQRGLPRDDARCDIGAYEDDSPKLTPTSTPSVTPSPTELFPACCLDNRCPQLCGATPIPTETRPPHVECVGDCNGDGMVRVHELVRLVNAVLSWRCPIELCPPPDNCLEADVDGDGTITASELVMGINRIVQAVGHAIRGCPL